MITEKFTSDPMTEGQLKAIKRLLEDGINSFNSGDLVNLGFTKEEAQEIFKKGNLIQDEIKTFMTALLKKFAIIDKRFGIPVEFNLTVPADYNHDTQIDASAQKAKKEKTTYYYNNDLNSKNFSKATRKLEPGKTYRVKMITILETVTSEDCMNISRRYNGILAGGQGVTLVYDVAKEKLLKGKWTISFDEKDALWEDADGYHRVPYVDAYSDGGFGFVLGYFEGDWDDFYVILVFCDLPASEQAST